MLVNPKNVFRADDIDRGDIEIRHNPKGNPEYLRLVKQPTESHNKDYWNAHKFSTGQQSGVASFRPQTPGGNPAPITISPGNPITEQPPSSAPPPVGTTPVATQTGTGTGDVPATDKTSTAPLPHTPVTDYAVFAKATYTHSPVEGWSIDNAFTNNQTTVYTSPRGVTVIAFAGTKFHLGIKTAFKDVQADLYISAGDENHSQEFMDAKNRTAQVIQKYGQTNVTATGHSLGGTKAAFVSSNFGIYAFCYNAGWQGAEGHGAKSQVYPWNLERVHWFNIWGDPVSLGLYQHDNTKKHVTTIFTPASKAFEHLLIEYGVELGALIIFHVGGEFFKFMIEGYKFLMEGYQLVSTVEEGVQVAEQGINGIAKMLQGVGAMGTMQEVYDFFNAAMLCHGIDQFAGHRTVTTVEARSANPATDIYALTRKPINVKPPFKVSNATLDSIASGM